MKNKTQNLALNPALIKNLEIHKIGSEFRASLVDNEKHILVNGYGADQNKALNDLFRNLI